MKKDIEARSDIELLVNTFYNKVQKDDLLGPIFIDLMKVDWNKHLPKMYDFWQNILFHTGEYKGQPFLPHLHVNEKEKLTSVHFDRWLSLFFSTIDELFEGEKTKELKEKSNSIKQVWSFKIDYINSHSQNP